MAKGNPNMAYILLFKPYWGLDDGQKETIWSVPDEEREEWKKKRLADMYDGRGFQIPRDGLSPRIDRVAP